MKYLKKLSVVVLILALVMSLTSVAFAANDNTITINGAKVGQTYKVYKMLDLKTNSGNTAFSYTVNSDWEAFFTGEGAGAAYVTINTNGYVEWKADKNTAAEMEKFGKAAAAYAKSNDATDSKKATANPLVFTGLESGYYLITSTYGTLAMVDTTPTTPDATVNEKNSTPVPDKEVQEDSTQNWGKENDAQIGDTVYYKTKLTLQKGALKYVMHDKMDDGLTFNTGSVAIEGLTVGTDYTVVTEGLEDGCTFEVRFTESYLNSITGQTKITVTYNAVLNENAKVEIPEINKVTLTWGENNDNESESTTTETKTHKFEVLKYDGKDTSKKNLAGAEFQLKDASGNVVKLIKANDTTYRVANENEAGAVDKFVTVASGNIVINGVDSDAYTLKEVTAPDGYNLIKNEITVQVDKANNLVVEIANNTGLELPGTGGMGTTLIYGAGAVLVIGAAVLLVSKKRMTSNK